jgi:hypothetical protein
MIKQSLYITCHSRQLHIEKSRASFRPGPKNINTTSPSSKQNPTKSSTHQAKQIHGRIQSPTTPKTSPRGHHPRLLHLHQPRPTAHHLPIRKGLADSLAQQDHPTAGNRSKTLSTQKWIDDSLSLKLLVRKTVFYLGTAY